MNQDKDIQRSDGFWAGFMRVLSKLFKGVGLIVLTLFVLMTVGVVFLFSGFQTEAEPTINSDLIEHQIQEAQELTTTKYHYTNAGAFENQNTYHGWNVPFTKKNFIVSYSGLIHAGINLEDVQVDVENLDIIVSLPEPSILSHEIDEESINVLDEDSSIFNPIKVDDYKEFSIDQEGIVESQAIERGLLETAAGQARDAITTVLELNPEVESQGYSVVFK
ncbi:DUF4230 domain-containing protein [Aerococcaceae bacterium DSM 111021]|nr:DUF4230 domain-containing protein [Aerococcaceae bacterium DSM 111021]